MIVVPVVKTPFSSSVRLDGRTIFSSVLVSIPPERSTGTKTFSRGILSFVVDFERRLLLLLLFKDNLHSNQSLLVLEKVIDLLLDLYQLLLYLFQFSHGVLSLRCAV